jgi:hypothetical protein
MSIQSVVTESCMDYLCGYICFLCCCGYECNDTSKKRRESITLSINISKPTDIEVTLPTARATPVDLHDEPIPKPTVMTPAVYHHHSPEPVPILIRAHT